MHSQKKFLMRWVHLVNISQQVCLQLTPDVETPRWVTKTVLQQIPDRRASNSKTLTTRTVQMIAHNDQIPLCRLENVDSLDLRSGNLGTPYCFQAQHRKIQDHEKSTRMTETKIETDFWWCCPEEQMTPRSSQNNEKVTTYSSD